MRYVPSIVASTRAAAGAAALCLVPLAALSGAVPEPLVVVSETGVFQLDNATSVQAPPGDAGAQVAAEYLRDLFKQHNGLDLRTGGTDTRHTITFARERGLPAEGYHLQVQPQGVRISASDDAGLFYGVVSLWQLAPLQSGGPVAAQRIEDAPRFAWRGLMLDSARHFQSPEFVHRMIDWMALHKLNVLHWHLTDDQGWRVEILKYPRLTTIGAWRGGEHEGGFYTQAQIRALVAFAATRHVRILPEIDLPGHATAAIAAYPALGAASTPLQVSGRWGVHTHLLNLEPGTLRFLDEVFAEILALFPSPDVHVGGDEVVPDEWLSASVQARMRALHLAPEEVQHYVTQHVSAFLTARGRRMVGWDEILTPTLSKEAIVMSWRGVAGARQAAAAGNDAVLSPDPALYFDHRQSTLREEPPGRLAPVDLKSVYEFEPVEPALSPAERRHVLGLQANLWTEHIRTEQRLEWMALPRAAAIAEAGWSHSRDWPRFLRALPALMRRYEALGLHYADSVFGIDVRLNRVQDRIEATLANLPGLELLGDIAIRVSFDGADPAATSPRYAQPLIVRPGMLLRAATYRDGERLSRVVAQRIDEHAGLRRDSHELERCGEAVGLLLEPENAPAGEAPLAVDIMRPCWWQRGVELTHGAHVSAAVAALPFNYELGADLSRVRRGDAQTRYGELRLHADGCDAPVIATLPFGPPQPGVQSLAAQSLPALAGRHDLCIDVARPGADPLWALDWIENTE